MDWYVIQTVKGQEEDIKEAAEQRMPGTSFKIVYKVLKRRYQGEWHEEKHILFPGYIFVITAHP